VLGIVESSEEVAILVVWEAFSGGNGCTNLGLAVESTSK
jgi:hypothetical protein